MNNLTDETFKEKTKNGIKRFGRLTESDPSLKTEDR